MKYKDLLTIYDDKNLLKFLRENSLYYKFLSRRGNISIMINDMKTKYEMTFKDKIDRLGSSINIIKTFMDVTKEK